MKLLSLKNRRALAIGALLCVGFVRPAAALDRVFTYTYEPETMVAGGTEVEQWVTLRTGRRELVGGANDRQNYNLWELRTELEYGVTDNYQVSLYLNSAQESFRDATGAHMSVFKFTGVSMENILNIVNPADHAVGVSLYVEPGFGGDTAEIEQKIIIGQRHGKWKWALNLNHAVEWENDLHDIEGEFGASFGITRFVGKQWAVGLEARNVNAMPDYKRVEFSAVYVGPAVSFRREKWFATLTVMPQIFGRNWDGASDGHRNLDLIHNERVNIRLIVGFDL